MLLFGMGSVKLHPGLEWDKYSSRDPIVTRREGTISDNAEAVRCLVLQLLINPFGHSRVMPTAGAIRTACDNLSYLKCEHPVNEHNKIFKPFELKTMTELIKWL